MRAFFDTDIHPEGYRYVRLYDNERAENLPLMGLSLGWVPATVVEEYSGTGDVLVRLHGSFADPYNVEGKPVRNLAWRVHPDFVLQRAVFSVTIDLSLVVVRWKDYWQQNRGKKGRSYNVLNEMLIHDVLHGCGSFREFFGSAGNYEIFTIFVKTSKHLDAINVNTLSDSLRGKQKAALYFLWPTQNQRCETNDGIVPAAALQSLMHRMEKAGIKTCWPHPADLYFELVSKSWVLQHQQCKHLDFKVPPTTFVRKQDLQPGKEAQQAAAAIEQLQSLSRLRGKTPRSKENYLGVVKLGYSWMSHGVIPFVGEDSLGMALLKLLDGASSDTHCLVQERVQEVICEMRAFCCQDMMRGTFAMKLVAMKMKSPQHQAWDETFCGADSLTMTARDLAVCFEGSLGKVETIHVKVRKLANLWLDWILETHSAPQCIRLDFLISRQSKNNFQAHTCAIKECGGSTCGIEVSPRTVAVVNRAAEGIAGFPKPLILQSEGWQICGLLGIEHQQNIRGSKPIPRWVKRRQGDFRHLVKNHTHHTTPHPANPRTLSHLWTNLAVLGTFATILRYKFRKVEGVDALLLRSLVVLLVSWALRSPLLNWSLFSQWFQIGGRGSEG